jgi:hypothetical protein
MNSILKETRLAENRTKPVLALKNPLPLFILSPIIIGKAHLPMLILNRITSFDRVFGGCR